MSSFTPGPWIVDTTPEGPHKIRHAGRYGHAVVALVPPAEGWSLLHQDHNACLVAESPAMLEALEWALGQIGDDLDLDAQEALEAARATVKRAKGE